MLYEGENSLFPMHGGGRAAITASCEILPGTGLLADAVYLGFKWAQHPDFEFVVYLGPTGTPAAAAACDPAASSAAPSWGATSGSADGGAGRDGASAAEGAGGWGTGAGSVNAGAAAGHVLRRVLSCSMHDHQLYVPRTYSSFARRPGAPNLSCPAWSLALAHRAPSRTCAGQVDLEALNLVYARLDARVRGWERALVATAREIKEHALESMQPAPVVMVLDEATGAYVEAVPVPLPMVRIALRASTQPAAWARHTARWLPRSIGWRPPARVLLACVCSWRLRRPPLPLLRRRCCRYAQG
jgi:hypothetical protein